MPPQDRMPRTVHRSLPRLRVAVRCRVLKPTTLALPRVEWESNASPSGRIDAAPIHGVSQGIKRAERCEHHRVLFFFTPQGRKHGAFPARVIKSLLNTTEKNGMRADFQENVMSIF